MQEPEEPDSARFDISVLRPSMELRLTSAEQIVKCMQVGTEEVQHVLKHECSIIYECNVCRNLFRGLPNLLAHKRVYCTTLYKNTTDWVPREDAHNFVKDPPQKSVPITEGEKEEEKDKGGITKVAQKVDAIASKGDSTDSKTQKQSAENKASTLSKAHDRLINADRKTIVKLTRVDDNIQVVTQSASASSKRKTKTVTASTSVKKVKQKDGKPVVLMPSQTKASVNRSLRGQAAEKKASYLRKSSQMFTKFKNKCDLKSLKCLECDTSFAHQRSLYGHMVNLHSKKKFHCSCPFCKQSFTKLWSLKRHLIRSHKKTTRQVERMSKKWKKESPTGKKNSTPTGRKVGAAGSKQTAAASSPKKPVRACSKGRGKATQCQETGSKATSAKSSQPSGKSVPSSPSKPRTAAEEKKLSDMKKVMEDTYTKIGIKGVNIPKIKIELTKDNKLTTVTSSPEPKSPPEVKVSSSDQPGTNKSNNQGNANGLSEAPILEQMTKWEHSGVPEAPHSREQDLEAPVLTRISPIPKSSKTSLDLCRCEQCGKTFGRKDTLRKHVEVCEVKNEYVVGDGKEENDGNMDNLDVSVIGEVTLDTSSVQVSSPYKSGEDGIDEEEDDMSSDELSDDFSGAKWKKTVEYLKANGVKIDENTKRCLKCKTTYQSRSNLVRHAIRHLGWRRYKCKYCRFTGYHRSECKRHIVKVHKFNPKNNYELTQHLTEVSPDLQKQCHKVHLNISPGQNRTVKTLTKNEQGLQEKKVSTSAATSSRPIRCTRLRKQQEAEQDGSSSVHQEEKGDVSDAKEEKPSPNGQQKQGEPDINHLLKLKCLKVKHKVGESPSHTLQQYLGKHKTMQVVNHQGQKVYVVMMQDNKAAPQPVDIPLANASLSPEIISQALSIVNKIPGEQEQGKGDVQKDTKADEVTEEKASDDTANTENASDANDKNGGESQEITSSATEPDATK